MSTEYNPQDLDKMERMLEETEQLSHELREEIRLQRQHEAVENLPELLDTAHQGKWSNLKLLLEELVNERRAKRAKKNGE